MAFWVISALGDVADVALTFAETRAEPERLRKEDKKVIRAMKARMGLEEEKTSSLIIIWKGTTPIVMTMGDMEDLEDDEEESGMDREFMLVRVPTQRELEALQRR